MKKLTNWCFILLAFLLTNCDESTSPDDDDSTEIRIDLGDLEPLLQFPDLTGTTLLIRNITVIDNRSGTAIPAQDVLIKEDLIDQIVNTDNINTADHIIDGSGKFLIPGLSDMHTHPVTTGSSARNDLFLFLAHGVTTIRVMWGFDGHLALRDSINQRDMLGPNMLVASQGFVGTRPFWPGSVQTATLAEVSARAQEFADQGYDYLKVYSGLSSDQYHALVDQALELGIPAIGHIPNSISLGDALSSGQTTIEHLGEVSNSSLSYQEIAQLLNSNNMGICPTLAVANRTTGDIASYQQNPIYQALSPPFKEWLQDPLSQPVLTNSSQFLSGLQTNVQALNQAQAPIISGTDMGIRYVLPGVSLHEELQLYVDAGLTPLEALNTSTLTAQSLINRNYPGYIAAGRLADLVILSDNPLEDIQHLSKIEGVIKSGYYLGRAEIDAIIAALIEIN